MKTRIEKAGANYFVDVWWMGGWKNDSSHRNLDDAQRRVDAIRKSTKEESHV